MCEQENKGKMENSKTVDQSNEKCFVEIREPKECGEDKSSQTDPQTEVIDLSSDDEDDVVMSRQPVIRRHVNTPVRRLVRPISCPRNIELISVGTDEIEIFPANEIISLNENGRDSPETEIIPTSVRATSPPTDVIDLGSEPEAVILPDDSSLSQEKMDSGPSPSSQGDSNEENATKESMPKETLPDKVQSSQIPLCENSNNESNSVNNNANESGGQSPPGEESTAWSSHDKSDNTPEVQEIDRLDKSDSNQSNLVEAEDPSTVDKADSAVRVAENCENPSGEHDDSCNDNNPSLVIGHVTSLNEQCERMEEDNSSQGDQETSTLSRTLDSTVIEDDHHPDLIMCDEDASIVTHIKEEPLSAGEITGDEEDPLNFHSVTIKREPEDWTIPSIEMESEDVKPNIPLLNENSVDYIPRKLKNGKYQCEPCRISFFNDVYYERHASSLRHKLNVKLFRNGKAPTKKRGKSLVQAVMGNTTHDISSYTYKSKGPFHCNQCPSVFKHLRNLKTHMKKHIPIVEQEINFDSEISSRVDSPILERSLSKPPTRLSAQNVRFHNIEETQCDLCHQTFTTFPALASHKRYCGYSEGKVCNWCHENFTTTSLYFKHRKECLRLRKGQSLKLQQQMSSDVQMSNSPSPAPSPAPVPLDGTVLACTLCNLTFQSSTDLISHMQQNHMDFGKPSSPVELPNFIKPNNFSKYRDSKMHYCKYCIRSFNNEGALSSHIGYHARKSVYCCKFCKQAFKDKLSFRQHMKVHIGDPSLMGKNVCWICYTSFGSNKDLMDHKSVHAKIKLKIYSCNICSNSYNTKELMYRHRRAAHNVGNYQQNPEEDLEEEAPCQSKVQYIDEDNKLFKCKICKKRFSCLGNVRRHAMIHKRTPFAGNMGSASAVDNGLPRCGTCFKTFKTLSGLMNHRPWCIRAKKAGLPMSSGIIPNPSNRPLRCKGCKKWFASKNSIYKHKLLKRCKSTESEAGDPFIPIVEIRSQNCPNCDQQFLSDESLSRHKLHCKPSIEKLTCDCGEVFSTVELKQTHADSCLSNCTCKTCNMKFNSPEELESHLLVCQVQPQSPASQQSPLVLDNRLPPTDCSKCGKKFVYSKCLQIHQDKCLYDRWPCTNCYEIFPNETSLTTHKKYCYTRNKSLQSSPGSSMLKDSPTFKCEHCPMNFHSGAELRQHSQSCENRPQVRTGDTMHPPFICNICDKSFLWKANLLRHQRMSHKLVNPGQVNLSGIERSVSSNSNSPARVNSDGESNVYKCKLCPEIVFHKKQGYLEHQRVHQAGNSTAGEENGDEGEIMLTCELCDKKLPESLYPLHMDEHMNDDFEEMNTPAENEEGPAPEKFPCDVCGKVFDTYVSRKSHRATHYRAGEVLAHLSPTKSSLKKRKLKVRHIRCNICNKLLSINSMPKHKMMHVREEAEFYGNNQSTASKSIPTTSTPRSSTPSVTSDISAHEELEDSTTSFSCPKCDKSFKLRKMLLDHVKSHQDNSVEVENTSASMGPADMFPYKCMYCDLSWKYKSLYERHTTSKKHLEIQKQLSEII